MNVMEKQLFVAHKHRQSRIRYLFTVMIRLSFIYTVQVLTKLLEDRQPMQQTRPGILYT